MISFDSNFAGIFALYPDVTKVQGTRREFEGRYGNPRYFEATFIYFWEQY